MDYDNIPEIPNRRYNISIYDCPSVETDSYLLDILLQYMIRHDLDSAQNLVDKRISGLERMMDSGYSGSYLPTYSKRMWEKSGVMDKG